jgi:hypothetical protein
MALVALPGGQGEEQGGGRAKSLRPSPKPGHNFVNELRRLIQECPWLTSLERCVALYLRTKIDNETLCTRDRISIAQIARDLGAPKRCSKRSVQRALRNFRSAGIITPLREKITGTKINDKNHYRFDPDRLRDFRPVERPAEWAANPRKGEAQPPSVYADAVERERAAAGLDAEEPRVVACVELAAKADRAEARLAEQERRLDAGRAKQVETLAALAEQRAGLAGGVTTSDAPKSSDSRSKDPAGGSDTERSRRAAAPARPATRNPAKPHTNHPRGGSDTGDVTGSGTGDVGPRSRQLTSPEPRLSPAERLAYDNEVLFLLRRSPLLAPIASQRRAAEIGSSARKAKLPLEQVEEALDRLVYKIAQGMYPRASNENDLIAIARGFMRSQWPSVHAPLPTGVLGELAARAGAPADEPTADEIAELHARFGLTPERTAELRAEQAARAAAYERLERALAETEATKPFPFRRWGSETEVEAYDGDVLRLRASKLMVREMFVAEILPALLAKLPSRVTVDWSIGPDIEAPLADAP